MSEALNILSNESLMRFVSDTADQRTLLEITLAERLYHESQLKDKYFRLLFEWEVDDKEKKEVRDANTGVSRQEPSEEVV